MASKEFEVWVANLIASVEDDVHRDLDEMSADTIAARAVVTDEFEALLDALAWAKREIDDAAEAWDENGTPGHVCEFRTNPEKGACSFHDGYWTVDALLRKHGRLA